MRDALRFNQDAPHPFREGWSRAVSRRTPVQELEGLRDRDLDIPRSRPPRVLSAFDRPQSFQRLIANPFLAIVGLIAWSALLREAIPARRIEFYLGFVFVLPLLPYLLQYHCLDCGRTGRLRRWREHECERVKARRISKKPRRFRGPTPNTQTVLWCYLTACMVVLGFILAN